MNIAAQKLLLLDYEKTLDFLDKTDNLLFQIKNWSIASSSAVLAFGVSQKSVVIVAGNLVLIAGFYLLELIYESFHADCIAKSHKLEELIYKNLESSFALPSDYKFGIGHTIEPPRPRKLGKLLITKDRWHIGVLYYTLAFVDVIAIVYVAAS
jgi:hypothetical protein